ncbi:MAG: type II glyceraldehyde-3-phosphate dehydrogenase [Candidatus Bathyarchaeota archaeon]
MVINVGINGFGTIGRRVADAVFLQNDMKLIGVVKTKPDYKANIAIKKGYSIYSPTEKELESFKNAGIKVAGTLDDLLGEIDIIIDGTPGKVGALNKGVYEKKGVKAIFEGGEKASVADVSFVAQCNFDKAVGSKYIRCVSCNTTGLCRTLNALDRTFGIKRARATLVRRAADPNDIKTGPVDAIVPDPTELPSHHGPDVNTVLPELPITTMAIKVPTTYMHVHTLSVTLKKPVTKEAVLKVFEDTTRVILVSKSEGIASTAHLFDYARDLGRSREDLYEICVWRESVTVVDDNEVYYMQAVHQEADVVPENIDAIRAALNTSNAEESIKKTNNTLKILK